MAFTSAFARMAALFSALESAGCATAGELAGLPDELAVGELEVRGALDVVPPGSLDAGSEAAPVAELLSMPRRTTSNSKSLTYTILELPGFAFASCGTCGATGVPAALSLGTSLAMEANKKNSGNSRKYIMGLPRRAHDWAVWAKPLRLMIEDEKKEQLTMRNSTLGAPIAMIHFTGTPRRWPF